MPQTPADESTLAHQTLQEAVVDHLRNLILNRQLLPGERLVQSELAERLGVSRTPIREALHRLTHEGFVTFSSYKGAAVAEFSPSELEEIYTVRSALESHAAYLAATRITEDELEQLESLLHQMGKTFHQGNFQHLLEVHHQFHASVYAAAHQRRLYDLTIQYLALCDVYQRMALSLGRGAKNPVVEHKEILEALRRREADAAAHLIRFHLQLTVSELQELLHKEQRDGGAIES
jgi:DNA-binding GntR family transcriptional regulator